MADRKPPPPPKPRRTVTKKNNEVGGKRVASKGGISENAARPNDGSRRSHKGNSRNHLSRRCRNKISYRTPRRFKTAFNFFQLQALRKMWDADTPREQRAHENEQLCRLVGKQWREMGADEKAPFLKMADEDKDRYKREVAEMEKNEGEHGRRGGRGRNGGRGRRRRRKARESPASKSQQEMKKVHKNEETNPETVGGNEGERRSGNYDEEDDDDRAAVNIVPSVEFIIDQSIGAVGGGGGGGSNVLQDASKVSLVNHVAPTGSSPFSAPPLPPIDGKKRASKQEMRTPLEAGNGGSSSSTKEGRGENQMMMGVSVKKRLGGREWNWGAGSSVILMMIFSIFTNLIIIMMVTMTTEVSREEDRKRKARGE
eukprot:jgi/Bigna1/141949/aug1.66_g16657